MNVEWLRVSTPVRWNSTECDLARPIAVEVAHSIAVCNFNARSVAALNDVKIQSQSAGIDWAAAKKITLATAGGASIVIEGGNITLTCPGTITVQAGSKSFTNPSNAPTHLPTLPRGSLTFDECFQLTDAGGDPVKNMRVEITNANGQSMLVVGDADGFIPLCQGFSADQVAVRVVGWAGGSA